ncbi:hypothetical protein HYH03_013347 [Edaphochlamys debaryana]|uniref:Uncharacterized protein n=1 Tax=Edaphochlamys debaryana TaxID=47281 RepID=A0A835XNA9_9CHLO|nr:hypothetical protein HYH03_013347 [Edaphochlamys debaryana]|eukprot:KAG2488042.1 hypothetical protein HYH03_013347 [Edaphochlamys debaryana]
MLLGLPRSAPAATTRSGPRSRGLWPPLSCRPEVTATKPTTGAAVVEESVPGGAAAGSGGQLHEAAVQRLAELLAQELGPRLAQAVTQAAPPAYADTETGTEASTGSRPRQAPGPLPPDPRLLARLEAVEARAAAAEAKAEATESKAAEAEAEARQARAEAARATEAAQVVRPGGGGDDGGGGGGGWRSLLWRLQEAWANMHPDSRRAAVHWKAGHKQGCQAAGAAGTEPS